MAIKKKNGYIPKSYESASPSKDKFVALYKSMIVSEAYQAINAKQRDLFNHCKLQVFSENLKEREEHPTAFTMNKYKWCTVYKLYTASNNRQFYRDIEALISHGFIKCVTSGKVSKTKNVYALSTKWRDYGTQSFKLSNDVKTWGMVEREKKLKSL